MPEFGNLKSLTYATSGPERMKTSHRGYLLYYQISPSQALSEE